MIPFMKDVEMCWPSQVDVRPVDIENLDTTMTQEIMSARKLIEHLNTRIEKVEADLKTVFCEFKTWRFSYYPGNKAKPAQISFGAETVECTAENLAKADKLTQMIEETARKRLAEEKSYSDYKEEFLGLSDRIETLGGTIINRRPFFDVMLPLSDRLGTESHHLLANNFNYLMLVSTIEKLERALEELTKKTSQSS